MLDPFAAQPSNASRIRFGDDLLLAGYDTYLNGRPWPKASCPPSNPEMSSSMFSTG